MSLYSWIQVNYTWSVSHIPCVGDTKDASQTVRVLKLSFIHAGRAQHATPQLYRIRMAYYVEVYGATEKFNK